ncbi:MAG: periplasmic heavy metal sensor [Hyphomonadaceae bacterium]|nr:periplasmic heavy metal sensor [Hyphomonadaceae bacterium]
MSDTRFPWRTLLFVSLALNLLVVGAVAGAWGAGVRIQRDASQGAIVERLPGPRAFLRALPSETRAVMRQELVSSWQDSRETREAAMQARREAFAAMAAEPYDAARVRAAFERLRAADQAAIAVFHNNVIEAFGELTPEQRREALQALRDAAPATRNGAAPTEESAAPAVLTPEQRETLQQRRDERRERWRQRREERARPQPPQP